jgi:hypothetical protein
MPSVTRYGWHWVLYCCVLGSLLSLARGSEADDHYLALFNQLRQVEQLEERGEKDEACEAFRGLYLQLTQFQRAYPSWHPEVVAFRLRYISASLKRLCQTTPSGPDSMAPDQALKVPAVDPPNAEDLLRLRLRQLELERDELQAKLREALAARPAAVDSPELSRASERIRTLEKEVALLRFATHSDSLAEQVVREKASTDVEASLQAQLQALKDELELERQKVAALEATASALSARLVSGDESKSKDHPGTATPAKPEPASPEPSSLEIGRALLEAGEVDEAILVLGREAQAPEVSAGLLSLLGRAFLSKGLIDPAEAVTQRALSADASCAEAHCLMARLCLLRSPPARSLARWHYHEARRHGLTPDPALEGLLSDAPTDPS